MPAKTRIVNRRREFKHEPQSQLAANNELTVFNNAVRTLSRIMLQGQSNKLRDINKECGYPATGMITTQEYQDMYQREGVAARVCDAWPTESWTMLPDLVDNDAPGSNTAFEEAWRDNQIFWCHYLERVDTLSGIGNFGVILFGLDDGLPLDQPVDGLENANPDEELPPIKSTRSRGKERKLLYMRTFPHALVDIVELENDITSPRYGQPKMYSITFADPTSPITAAADTNVRKVHWTRVLHVAEDIQSSEWLSCPRQENVYNRLLDLQKTYGGTAEAMWRLGFPGISFESMPGWEDADFDEKGTKDQVERYMHSLQNYLTTRGMKANVLNANVDASKSEAIIDANIKNIAITKRMPWRVFAGAEQASLASTTDERTWNRRVMRRNTRYVGPRLLQRFVNRLVWFGVMPPPETGDYKPDWPDLNAPTDQDVAERADTLTRAMAKYMDSGVDSLVPPLEFLTTIAGIELDTAKAILQAAAKYADAHGDDEGDDDDETDEPQGTEDGDGEDGTGRATQNAGGGHGCGCGDTGCPSCDMP